jgi:serine/threonine protein kinase
MAPEQARGKACQASDVWAVGLVAVTLLTGGLPYKDADVVGKEALALVLAIGSGTLRPRLAGSDDMRAFLSKCFEAEATNRPTAQALLSDPVFGGFTPAEVTPQLTPMVRRSSTGPASHFSERSPQTPALAPAPIPR